MSSHNLGIIQSSVNKRELEMEMRIVIDIGSEYDSETIEKFKHEFIMQQRQLSDVVFGYVEEIAERLNADIESVWIENIAISD